MSQRVITIHAMTSVSAFTTELVYWGGGEVAFLQVYVGFCCYFVFCSGLDEQFWKVSANITTIDLSSGNSHFLICFRGLEVE